MGITMKYYGGASGNRGASLFPEGRTYSPPRRRKVRFPPFLPDGENCGRSLAPPLPTKPAALRGPLLGGGIPPAGRARALSEGDCVSCGSRWTMPQPGRRCCHRPRSRSTMIGWHFATPHSCRLPAQTCHRQLCRRVGRIPGRGAPIFFL